MVGEVDFGRLELQVTEPKRRTRAATRTPRTSAKIAALTTEIAEEIVTAGGMVSVFSPTLGYCVVEDAMPVSQALLRLAADKPWMLNALAKAAEAGAGVRLGRIGIRWSTAFAVDRAIVAPDSIIATVMNVTEPWMLTHPELVQEAIQGGWTPPAKAERPTFKRT